MSRTFKDSPTGKGSRPGGGRQRGQGRRGDLSVRAVRRDPADLRKLSRALIDLAIAQAEAEASSQPTPTAAGTGDVGEQPDTKTIDV